MAHNEMILMFPWRPLRIYRCVYNRGNTHLAGSTHLSFMLLKLKPEQFLYHIAETGYLVSAVLDIYTLHIIVDKDH